MQTSWHKPLSLSPLSVPQSLAPLSLSLSLSLCLSLSVSLSPRELNVNAVPHEWCVAWVGVAQKRGGGSAVSNTGSCRVNFAFYEEGINAEVEAAFPGIQLQEPCFHLSPKWIKFGILKTTTTTTTNKQTNKKHHPVIMTWLFPKL